MAIAENPDINFTWGLIITNMSESEARDYMLQINKQKPIRYEQIKTWDTDRKENLVVKVIVGDKISRLDKRWEGGRKTEEKLGEEEVLILCILYNQTDGTMRRVRLESVNII